MTTAQNAKSENKPKRKIALAIGIGNYTDGQNLPNAIKDAEDVTAALKRMGFIIEKPELDLDYAQMELVIVKFQCSIKAGDLVFFYFAGHGIQWENQNYLIPSNNREIVYHKLYNYAINAQQKLSSFNVREPFATILILDCCRTYHLSRNINLDKPVTRGPSTKELDEPVQMLGDESLTMFSCADGTTASDGSLDGNGVFTKHLLQHMETANKPVYIVFADVMRGVKEESKLAQIPKMYTSLTYSDLYLNEQMSIPLRAPAIDIHSNARWQQNGLTVAGGNGKGNGNNQLSHPCGLYIDDDQTIYIADRSNHRIIEWKWNATSGQVVAGGNKEGNEAHQLSYPLDVIVDKERDNLIICDNGNRRVVRWPRRNGTSGETIISNIDCWGGLTMDENGSLYVSDGGKHEVRRYRRGESQGTVIAGGNGYGNRLDQLSNLSYVFIDRDHSVYVSEYGNHRVMKWMEGTKEGIVVAGGQDEGNSLRQLSYPYGVVVDQLDTVYVADCGNARIMRWMKGATQGNIIVGENDEGRQSNQLNCPAGLSFDRHGNLYIVNNGNHSVQKFNIDRNA